MMNFKKLHEQKDPLFICNIWDAQSVKIAEKLRFEAVGTSSAAMASMLGYKDGEEMTFAELEFLLKRTLANTTLNVSVDLESGYSDDPLVVVDHIKCLHNMGVVGINIEDSVIHNGRVLSDTDSFTRSLSTIKNQLERESIDIFLNVRTDSFLLKKVNAVAETRHRIQLYEDAGADGIFVPCIVQEEDITAIVESTKLPVNVMCMPGLPTFDVLMDLGVKRISMGNFFYDHMFNFLQENLRIMKETKSFNHIF